MLLLFLHVCFPIYLFPLPPNLFRFKNFPPIGNFYNFIMWMLMKLAFFHVFCKTVLKITTNFDISTALKAIPTTGLAIVQLRWSTGGENYFLFYSQNFQSHIQLKGNISKWHIHRSCIKYTKPSWNYFILCVDQKFRKIYLISYIPN